MELEVEGRGPVGRPKKEDMEKGSSRRHEEVEHHKRYGRGQTEAAPGVGNQGN